MGKEIRNRKTTGDEVFGGRHTQKKDNDIEELIAGFVRHEKLKGMRKTG